MSRATLSMADAWVLGVGAGIRQVTLRLRRRLLSRGVDDARAAAANGRTHAQLSESDMIEIACLANLGEMAAVAIEMLDLSKR